MIFLAYSWLRKVDDIMDAECDPPLGMTVERYVTAKAHAIQCFQTGCFRDTMPEDRLLLQLWRDSQEICIDISAEFAGIWECMEEDYSRRVNKLVMDEEWLNLQATLYDSLIIGTSIKLLDGDNLTFLEIARQFRGLYTRTDWLHDLPDDLRQGICNIPEEALEKYRINLKNLQLCRTIDELLEEPGFTSWYRDEVEKARKDWEGMTRALGHDFGCSFKNSHLLAWLLMKLMSLWFDRSVITSPVRSSHGV